MSLVLFGCCFLGFFFKAEIVTLILLKPPLAHSQNICVMRRAMTLPNALNRAIFGLPPRSLSICPSPAQQFIVSPKSLTPLRSPASALAPIPVPRNPVTSHPRATPSLFLELSIFFCRLTPGKFSGFPFPKPSGPQGTKGQSPLLAKGSRAILWHRSLPSAAKTGINPKSRGIKFCPLSIPAHASSSCSLVPFLFGLTFQVRLNLLASLSHLIQPCWNPIICLHKIWKELALILDLD